MELAYLINSRSDNYLQNNLNFSRGLGIDVDTVSSSIVNDYVPLFSAFHGDFKSYRGQRYNSYSLPARNCHHGPNNSSANFRNALSFYISPFIYKKGDARFFVCKGCIWVIVDNLPVILYVLTIKSDYLFGDTELEFDSLDYSKLKMVVNREFENPIYRLMFNFVKKEVFTPLGSAGIDLIYTSNIKNWGFNEVLEPLTFPTLAQRREYLNNLTNEVIDGITGRERPTEITAPIPDNPRIEEPHAGSIPDFPAELRGESVFNRQQEVRGQGIHDQIERYLAEPRSESMFPDIEARMQELQEATGLPRESFDERGIFGEPIPELIQRSVPGDASNPDRVEYSEDGGVTWRFREPILDRIRSEVEQRRQFDQFTSREPEVDSGGVSEATEQQPVVYTNTAGTRLSDEILTNIFYEPRGYTEVGGNTGTGVEVRSDPGSRIIDIPNW